MRYLWALFIVLIVAVNGCSKKGQSNDELPKIYAEIRAANEAGNHQKAYDLASKALEQYPGNWELHEKRAYAQISLRNFEGVLADANAALASVPAENKWRIMSLRAQGQESLGKRDLAESDYAEACKLLPATAPKAAAEATWNSRGRNLLRAERWADGAAAFDEALKLLPDSGRSLGGRCVAYAKLGDKERFAKDFEALKKYPKIFAVVESYLKKEGVALPAPTAQKGAK